MKRVTISRGLEFKESPSPHEALVDALSSYPPPPLGLSHRNLNRPGNTVAISTDGLVFFLTNEGLFMYDLESPEECTRVEYKSSISAGPPSDYTNIELNNQATMLMMWGPSAIGAVEIQHSMGRASCSYVNLNDVVLENVEYRILKARCHPLHPSCVCALLSNFKLCVIDIKGEAEQESRRLVQWISLQTSPAECVSFCFGPNTLTWLPFSIFVLLSDGTIRFLSPVIPGGCTLSRTRVNALWEWSRRRATMCVSDPFAGAQYRSDVCEYLHGVTGFVERTDQSYIRAGCGAQRRTHTHANTHASSPDTHLHTPITRTGPFDEDDEYSRTEIVNDFFDFWVPETQELRYDNAAPSSRARACDVTFFDDMEIPVICIAYEDGRLDTLILDDDVYPSWMLPQSGSPIRPTAYLVDRIYVDLLSSSSSTPLKKDFLSNTPSSSRGGAIQTPIYLVSDPLVHSFLHVVCPSKGVAVLLSARWLAASTKNMIDVLYSIEDVEMSFVPSPMSRHGLIEEEKEVTVDENMDPTSAKGRSMLIPVSRTRAEDGGSIRGYALMCGPRLGHNVCIRLEEGARVKNLSVITELHEISSRLSTPSGSVRKAPSGSCFAKHWTDCLHEANSVLSEIENSDGGGSNAAKEKATNSVENILQQTFVVADRVMREYNFAQQKAESVDNKLHEVRGKFEDNIESAKRSREKLDSLKEEAAECAEVATAISCRTTSAHAQMAQDLQSMAKYCSRLETDIDQLKRRIGSEAARVRARGRVGGAHANSPSHTRIHIPEAEKDMYQSVQRQIENLLDKCEAMKSATQELLGTKP